MREENMMREPFVDFMEKEIDKDSVVITCGLPATNKTETMEVLARGLREIYD